MMERILGEYNFKVGQTNKDKFICHSIKNSIKIIK